MIHLFTKASDQEPSVDGIIKILRNTRNKQLEALFEGTSLQPGKTTETGRDQFSTTHISATNPDKPVTFQAQTSDLADKAIQVDLPNLEVSFFCKITLLTTDKQSFMGIKLAGKFERTSL